MISASRRSDSDVVAVLVLYVVSELMTHVRRPRCTRRKQMRKHTSVAGVSPGISPGSKCGADPAARWTVILASHRLAVVPPAAAEIRQMLGFAADAGVRRRDGRGAAGCRPAAPVGRTRTDLASHE